MDYQEFFNITSANKDLTTKEAVGIEAYRIILASFSIIGVSANLIIAYTIMHFRKLYIIPANLYLANWAIADLMALIVTPSNHRVFSIFYDILFGPITFYPFCVFLQGGLSFHAIAIGFIILIIIDWFLAAHFENPSEKFRGYYRYYACGMWLAFLGLTIFSVHICFKGRSYPVMGLILLMGYCVILISVICLHCSRYIREYRGKPVTHPVLMLILATVFVIPWLCGFSYLLNWDLDVYVSVHAIIAECAISSSSVFNLILLYCLNGDFEMCLRQMCRCSDYKSEQTVLADHTEPNAQLI